MMRQTMLNIPDSREQRLVLVLHVPAKAEEKKLALSP